MTKYKLVQQIEGRWITTDLTEQNVVPAIEVRGYPFIGLNQNPKHRPELRNQPKFKGLAGPMWDGGVIRYEDQKTNDALSV